MTVALPPLDVKLVVMEGTGRYQSALANRREVAPGRRSARCQRCGWQLGARVRARNGQAHAQRHAQNQYPTIASSRLT